MTDWESIVRREGPAVWRVLWPLLAQRADVEECFQETFVAAVKLARREIVESWPATLTALATARGMDRLRERYRARRLCHTGTLGDDSTLAMVASSEAGPVERAVATELSTRLREALAQLPERQAEVFYLFACCGVSQREIGQRMDMKENAVSVAMHRARTRLRELLDDVTA